MIKLGTFETALAFMKLGHVVQRKGWDEPIRLKDKTIVGASSVRPWLPDMEELLATDWHLAEEPTE